VRLGADACIVGRNVPRTEAAAEQMRALRRGARVLGIGGVDVRRYEDLERAVARCVGELGGLDFVMCVLSLPFDGLLARRRERAWAKVER
jgi:peroxisomal 2,4-dienoyl-CoA reductase